MAKKKRRKAYKKPVSIGLKINDMIANCNGRERLILLELKELNKEAYTNYFLKPNSRLKGKYRELQKDPIWSQARKLLWEYFQLKGDGLCQHCKNPIDLTDSVLHHTHYKHSEYFTPEFVAFIHNNCHKQIHIIKNNSIRNYKKRR